MKSEFYMVVCAGIALRAIISLYSYSGAGTPPMYGDYEAQRHWQEITVNLSPKEWYLNTTNNNLLYWGLDYPPFSAYHSYIMGRLANAINTSYIELHTSQGIETSSHKSFMRYTVLAADILILIPSAVFCTLSVAKFINTNSNVPEVLCLQHLVIILIYPGQILIDNGHFQYNNVSLGLAAFAIACVLKENHVLSSILFTLALNYKQMELYHAIPFFIYLARICLNDKRFFTTFFKIGCAVVLTSIIIWIPWIHSINNIRMVINRIFPLVRGVYEDKVANFWCAVNVVIKLKSVFSNQQLAILCFLSTLASLAPSATNLFLVSSKRIFLYSLLNCALCFYLFSFQVHEKSILLTSLPALALYNEHPHLIFWFLQLTTCSMIPLFMKDGLILPFLVMFFLYFLAFNLLCELFFYPRDFMCQSIICYSKYSYLIIFSLIICTCFAPAPGKFPFIYTFVILLFIFMHFFIFLIYFTYKQLDLKNLKI